MKTLVATAEPGKDNRPIMMFVDGTAADRAEWGQICDLVGVTPRRVGIASAIRLVSQGFAPGAVIIGRDPSHEPHQPNQAVNALIQALAANYYNKFVVLATNGLEPEALGVDTSPLARFGKTCYECNQPPQYTSLITTLALTH